MDEDKGFVEKQKDDWKKHLFRKPSRGWWAFAGLAGSFVMIFFGLSEGSSGAVETFFPPFGVLEGIGLLFGSLAEFMPEEQTTLAGILRLWAGLFVLCGFALIVLGGTPGW